MARILFTTFGSYGDLNPYLAIGGRLRERGHRVTIATSETYRAKIESESLEFHPVRPDVPVDDPGFIRDIFDVKRGSERVIRFIASAVRESYEDTFPAAENADVVVSHVISFAAVAAAEKLRKPWISTVLAPFSFISAFDPPVLAPAPWLANLNVLGPGFMRRIFDVGRKQSRAWLEPVLQLRRELSLPTAMNPLFEGSHSPELVLALFSKYLAEPQPDWPGNTLVTGFPFHDRHHEQPSLPEDLRGFLEEGCAPLVFTLGSSAVGAAGDFYLQSLEAVRRLSLRAVFLLGPFSQGLPDRLPGNVIAVPYAPHSEVFPRAAAIVHQGGIGTTAQAMASGRPMLVVPFAHDQFDNGERVRRLGVAEILPRGRYTASRATRELRVLTATPTYERAAADLGSRVRTENGSIDAADAIEKFHDRVRQ